MSTEDKVRDYFEAAQRIIEGQHFGTKGARATILSGLVQAMATLEAGKAEDR